MSTELLLVTLAGFAAALAAPVVCRNERLVPWLLAIVPAAMFGYFLSQLGAVSRGEALTVSYEWVPALGVDLALRLDGLSALFALLITGIGTLVVVYTGDYMHGNPRLGRFYLLLLAFMASMLGLVLADNLVVLFVFWELTSITSYGPISFESEKESSRTAAAQALFVTGGSGLALLAGFVLLSIAGGTYSVSGLVEGGSAPLREHALYAPVLLLVVTGAFAKSAQAPLYFWLPNAMAAPTPVSAYLHSATMVKAGVYLLARLNPVLGGSDAWFFLLTIAGGVTMVLGAVFALRESDLKRVLAYSTLSTLGMLVLLIGAGTPETMLAAIVLLLAHAVYKATLFLNAGIIDHETGTRDLDELGGLARSMPVTAATTAIAAASMAGFVLLFGFIAKETVYEAVQHLPRYGLVTTGIVMYASVLLVAVGLIVAIRPFWGQRLAPREKVHEGGLPLVAGPVLLCALGLLLGVFPGVVDQELLGPAAAAAMPEASEPVKLYLWHGLNLTLLLSGVTLAAGAGVYLVRGQTRRILQSMAASMRRRSPEALYNAAMAALPPLATRQTRFLQHGYLRLYLTAVVVAATLLVGGTMLLRGAFDLPQTTSGLLLYEVVIAAVIFAAAIVAVFARTRLVAAVGLGAVGYGIALLYLLFGAPDLAMTQILVETLIVLLFVFAFYRLPRFVNYTTTRQRLRDVGIAVSAGVLVMALMLTSLSVQRDSSVSTVMAEVSKPIAHGSNVVNVILVDIRALDTMGEITVLLVAAVGVLALLKLTGKQEERS